MTQPQIGLTALRAELERELRTTYQGRMRSSDVIAQMRQTALNRMIRRGYNPDEWEVSIEWDREFGITVNIQPLSYTVEPPNVTENLEQLRARADEQRVAERQANLTKAMDALARGVFIRAVDQGRSGELMECLTNGGTATVDRATGELILYQGSTLQDAMRAAGMTEPKPDPRVELFGTPNSHTIDLMRQLLRRLIEPNWHIVPDEGHRRANMEQRLAREGLSISDIEWILS